MQKTNRLTRAVFCIRVSMHPEQTIILIEKLLVPCHVGVPLAERRRRQVIEIGVRCELAEALIVKDDLSSTVSYADLVEDIQARLNKRSYVLLECMASELAEACFKYKLVKRVCIDLRKRNKLPLCAAVGVERVFTRE